MKKRLHRTFQALWPFGLFLFYVLIILSFTNTSPQVLALYFGLAVVLSASVAWLVADYVRESDQLVKNSLEELSELLKPYDGMRLSEMPPDVQAEVRKRLHWTEQENVKNDQKSPVA